MNTLTLSRVSSGVVAAGLALAALIGVSVLIARADTAPTITQVTQNSSNAAITSAPIGSEVHSVVTVASTTASTTPTGTVDFNVYGNTSCSGAPTVQSGVSLVGGIATSSNTTMTANGLSYLVHYNGDASTTAANSSCKAVEASAASVNVVATLSTSTVLAGSSVYASSVLNNETANATGTVTYNIYTNNLCTTGLQSAGAKIVTNGNVPNSNTVQFNTPGTYYWQAVYSGDQFNSAATSGCQSSILTVLATSTPNPPPATSTPGTISGYVFNDLNKNDVKDGSDTGLAGFKVWLHLGAKKNGYKNPIIQTATTDSTGRYVFSNLAVGNYFVELEEQKKNGWKQTSDDMKVVLSTTTTSGVVDFANVQKNATSTRDGHDKKDKFENGHDNGNHWGWFKDFWKNWKKDR